MKRLALVAAAVAFVALGVVSTPARAATDHAVGVVDFGYKTGDCPASGASNITITAGDSITWENCSATVTHTVTALDGSFNRTLGPGDTFKRTFNASGPSIQYRCEIHKDSGTPMNGSILVQPPTTTTAKPTTTTTATTIKPTTTSSSTSTSTTQTTLDLNGLFDGSSTTSSSSSTSSTTELAIKPDTKDGSGSGLVIALLVLAIAGVGVGAYAVWRRMQQAT